MIGAPIKTKDDLAAVHVEESNSKHAVAPANDQEASVTFLLVWQNHKAVIWWSFYWAMCATGWYDLFSFLTCRGNLYQDSLTRR